MAQAIQPKRASSAAGGPGSDVLAFPVRAWSLLPDRGRAAGSALAAIVLSGLGHGGMAIAAGLLARALARPDADAGPLDVMNVTYVGLASACVKSGGAVFSAFSQANTTAALSRALRKRALRSFAARGLPDVAPRILAMIAVRLREVEGAVAQGALAAARAVAQIAPILLGLILLSPLLAGVGALVLVPFAVGLSALRRRWRAAQAGAQAAAEALHASVDELVRNIDLWRAYGATPRLDAIVDATAHRAARASARAEATRAALSSMNEILGALALVGVVAVAGRLGATFGDGTLIAFAAMCFMAYRPLRDLGDARAWLERGALALAPLLDLPEALEAAPTQQTPRRFSGSRLEFCRFGARARGPRTSLFAEPGEIVAIMGPSGSGKTTLLRVLLGLEPAVGRLLHGDEDLTHAPVGPAHRPFAWVPQDAPLVTGTVLENVALLSGDERAAASALAWVGASSLIDSGLVGPAGRELSGGERRLVAIARALATDLPVLLIDEPCAGLDAGARARVLGALRSLRGRRTLLVVTHEDDVAGLADRVVRIGEDAAGREAAE